MKTVIKLKINWFITKLKKRNHWKTNRKTVNIAVGQFGFRKKTVYSVLIS